MGLVENRCLAVEAVFSDDVECAAAFSVFYFNWLFFRERLCRF